MKSILCSLFAIATFLLLTSVASFECPDTCVAAPGEASVGSVPGTNFYVIKGPAENGTATNLCEGTCTQCKQTMSVYFDGGGALCMTVDLDGSGPGGPTNPMPRFNKSGYLLANCGPTARCVWLQFYTSCGDPPSESDWAGIQVHCLSCAC